MSTNNLYSIVKKYVDEYDFYDLLAVGAPSDEYDTESAAIAASINSDSTIAEITVTISKVFSKSFAASDLSDIENSNKLIELATKIKNEILF